MTPCIEGTGKDNGTGYLQVPYKGRLVYEHRLAYVDAKSIPLAAIDGLVVRHSCDYSHCRNAEHLVIGTQKQNMQDAVVRGRISHGADRPAAKLTPEQVATIKLEFVRRSKTHGGPALGRKYGVHHSVITEIISGKRWKHT